MNFPRSQVLLVSSAYRRARKLRGSLTCRSVASMLLATDQALLCLYTLSFELKFKLKLFSIKFKFES